MEENDIAALSFDNSSNTQWVFTPDLQALIFKTSWGVVGEERHFFGKETAALRLLMHLNPEQKMKSLWTGAKQYNDFPLISGSSS